MMESRFQKEVIDELHGRFPDCIVLKNDSSYIQGIPDLIVLVNDRWATLECKKDSRASRRPNQEYYVRKMDDMSFSAFIYPENRQAILDELEEFMRR